MRTGHRRLDGVRSYKRTDEDQQIDISRTLQKSTSTATKISTEEIKNKDNLAICDLASEYRPYDIFNPNGVISIML